MLHFYLQLLKHILLYRWRNLLQLGSLFLLCDSSLGKKTFKSLHVKFRTSLCRMCFMKCDRQRKRFLCENVLCSTMEIICLTMQQFFLNMYFLNNVCSIRVNNFFYYLLSFVWRCYFIQSRTSYISCLSCSLNSFTKPF